MDLVNFLLMSEDVHTLKDFPLFPMLTAAEKSLTSAQDQLVQQLQISSRPTAKKLSGVTGMSRERESEQ